MIKNVLNQIEGVEIYPIISLCIFVLFFVGLIGYVMTAKKDRIEKISQLPLES